MRFSNYKNIFLQAIKHKRFFVMLDKIFIRLSKYNGSLSNEKNKLWIDENISDLSIFANKLNSELWIESELYSQNLERHSEEVLKDIKYMLGGGAAHNLLYFLTRFLRPNTVLETGVAAGFSSASILSALNKNTKGTLYSSDFPYFRINKPEQYIGILVKKELRNRWSLYIDGDKNNFDLISKKIKKIDLLSYDSDKSYLGRKRFFKLVSNYLTRDTVIVMDDIQDNSFFYDYVTANKISNWKIFKHENKFLGLIGNFPNLAR